MKLNILKVVVAYGCFIGCGAHIFGSDAVEEQPKVWAIAQLCKLCQEDNAALRYCLSRSVFVVDRLRFLQGQAIQELPAFARVCVGRLTKEEIADHASTNTPLSPALLAEVRGVPIEKANKAVIGFQGLEAREIARVLRDKVSCVPPDSDMVSPRDR